MSNENGQPLADDYVPTTGQVQRAYVMRQYALDVEEGREPDAGRYGTEFVRWITAHEAKVRAADPLRNALLLLIDQSQGSCANTTTPGLGHCFDDGKTADAKYGIDMACPACVAHAALNGLPIPLGPGRDAEAEIPDHQREKD